MENVKSHQSMQISNGRRTFWWWAKAIFAPLGASGGCLSSASMASGTIQWNGPINFLVAYWDNYISLPFCRILKYVAQILDLPSPTEWLVNYFIFGVLFTSRYWMAWTSVKSPQKPGDLPRWVKTFEHLFLWPVTTYITVRSIISSIIWGNGVQSWAGVTLTFAPMLLFGALWTSNSLFY